MGKKSSPFSFVLLKLNITCHDHVPYSLVSFFPLGSSLNLNPTLKEQTSTTTENIQYSKSDF
jgi:hypothetical protein